MNEISRYLLPVIFFERFLRLPDMSLNPGNSENKDYRDLLEAVNKVHTIRIMASSIQEYLNEVGFPLFPRLRFS